MVFSLGRFRAMVGGYAQLTRRRSTDAPRGCWHNYYGDVPRGTMRFAAAIPMMRSVEWHCGFIPGQHPGTRADTLPNVQNQPVPTSKPAWEVFLCNRTQADFLGMARSARLDRAQI